MRPTAVLASELVRPALVLTAAVPGGYGGGEGGGGKRGGEGGGGGAGQVETVPPKTLVRVVAQEQTVPPMLTKTSGPFGEMGPALFPLMVDDEMANVPTLTRTPPPPAAAVFP